MRHHTAELQRRQEVLRQKLQQLEDAFYRGAIDQASYESQRDRLREQLGLLEIELHEARLDELDVEGVLGFAERLLTDAAAVWTRASAEQKQRLQRAFFPDGVPYDGKWFGTAPICLAFKWLPEAMVAESGVASPTGSEPFTALGNGWPSFVVGTVDQVA